MSIRSNCNELNHSAKIATAIMALGFLGLAGGAALEAGESIQVNEQQLVDVDTALPFELAGGGLALVLGGQQLLIRSARNRQ